MLRGEVWWADLPPPTGSGPGDARPVLILSADEFNRSRLATVIVAVVTGTLRLAGYPGTVPLSAKESGLKRDSVANLTSLQTVDRALLRDRAGKLPAARMGEMDRALATVLALTAAGE